MLTPKARTLYGRARRLKNVASAYRIRSKNLRRRLKLAEKDFKMQSSSLRNEAVQFCLQQLTRKSTKPRGRRFTMDEKLMSLALYKTSGAAYRFLSKWFNLPSRQTLRRLLQGVPSSSGINQYLMNNLKMAVEHFKPRDKLCILMFDEVSLNKHITFNKHMDRLVGIEDGRICDHALVFMVRGVTRKWKQAICYTFCRGSTKPLIIKTLLVSLVQELKNAGMYLGIMSVMHP